MKFHTSAPAIITLTLLTVLFLQSTLMFSNITVSANIIDDLKNTFQNNKPKIKQEVKENKTQNDIELDERASNRLKICNISKDYVAKHFTNRQETRTKEIDTKIANMTKIKTLFANNKQDTKELELLLSNLTKSLQTKKELLTKRVQNSNNVKCESKSDNWQAALKENNNVIKDLDQQIQIQLKDFGAEARRLRVIMTQPKIEPVL